MKKSLRDRLIAYFKKTHGYVASGDLQRLVMQHTSYTPSNVSRRLRELVEDGVLEVQYRQNHAFYRAKSAPGATLFTN